MEGYQANVYVRHILNGRQVTTSRELRYDYSTFDIEATAGDDYDTTTGTYVIPVGHSRSQLASFPSNYDDIDEHTERFGVHLTIDAGPPLSHTHWIYSIVDDDPPPELSVEDDTAEEVDGSLEFRVTLSVESGKEITVGYATSDGSATAPADYAETSRTLTINAGETEATISVPIVNDGIVESDETMTLTLSNPRNVTISDGSATGTIEDSGKLPQISVADASGVEDDVGNLSFVVTLDAAGVGATTMDYATADGTATAGSDYTEMSGSLTFAQGDLQKTIAVPVLADSAAEDDESLTLTLSNAANGVLRDREAAGTIFDDDATLTVVGQAVPEAHGSVEFTLTLEGGGSQLGTVTIDYATSDGTATAGSDYTSTSGMLTFSDVGMQTVTVAVQDDSTEEPDETFTLTLTPPSNVGLAQPSATGTILNDDGLSVALTAEPPLVSESAGAVDITVTATLEDGVRTVATTVTVSVAWSGNFDAVDFVAVTDFDITIAAGETTGTGTFDLRPSNDSQSEDDEQVQITGTSDLPVTGTTLTIEDDDVAATGIALSAEPPRVSEDAGATAVTVTAALNADARTVNTTVTVSVAGSGAADAVDFAAVSDFEIEITAGSTSGTGTFTLTPEDDSLDESDETLTLAGSSDLPATGTTITLEDDDATSTRIVLSASPSRVSEGAGATAVAVTAALDGGARTVDTAVTLSVVGSGTADAVDFAAVSDFEIEITAGSISGTGTFTLTPEDDVLDESDETLAVDGSSNLPVTGTTVTLADDDATSTGIVLSASPTRVSEGAGATAVTVTAVLDGGARTADTTVTVSVAGSGAADAVDYAAVSDFEIEITAGSTSGTGTFTLTPEDDILDESDETLTVGGSADLPVTGTAVVLADDDATSTGIVLSASPTRVSEGAGATAASVTAALDGGARTVDTAVTVTVAGSGVADAVDFASVPDFQIDIPAGSTSGTGMFTLTPEDDVLDESDETLAVDGSSNLPVTGTTVTLADDDPTSTGIVLSAMPANVSEGAGATAVTVTATLDGGARTADTVVTVSVSGSGAADAVDFAAVSDFGIDIPAGATSGTGTFTLTPEDDVLDESDETLAIDGSSNLPVTGTSVTLVDDDATSTGIVLSAVPANVSEGAGATEITVTATLDGGALSAETIVTVSVSGGGAIDAVDFAAVLDFEIDIPAGSTSGAGTFTLDPEDDAVDESDETLAIDGTSALPVTGTSVTLIDDDATTTGIVLSASPARISEGAGPTTVAVTASLNGSARTAATTVSVTVSGSGDPDAVDFSPVPGFEIDIPAGAASGAGTFTLEPEDDSLDEVDETLTVAGTSALPVAGTNVTLADDDATSMEIVLSASPSRVSEGDGSVTVTVTATLEGAARVVPTTVSVSVSDSGDPGAVDLAAVPDFGIDIPPGATSGSGTFTLEPEDDAVDEMDETLTVDGTSDLPVTGTRVALADDDATSTRIVLSASPSRVSEGAGPTSVKVTATLDGGARAMPTPATVSVSASGDPNAVDFATVPGFGIDIPAGAISASGTFLLEPQDDVVDETDETLAVDGSSDLPVTGTRVTLADDDATSAGIVLTASPSPVSEGAGPTPVTVTATLDGGARILPTAVSLSVSASGVPDASDFAPVPDFGIDIPVGATSGTGTFMLEPEDDDRVEADERLTISGTSDLPVTSTGITLADDDEVSTRVLLFLVVDPPRASEGDGEIRVAVTAAVDKGVRTDDTRINVSVAGRGDPDAVDFAPIPDFGIVIPANVPEGTATFTVVPEDDLIAEADETLTVTGESDLPVTPATMELLDDDETTGRILLSADPARMSEGDGPAVVTVTASLDRGVRQEPTTVTVAVEGGGDPYAVDFIAVPDFGIEIPANAARSTATFALLPEDDLVDEADETLTVSGVSDLPVTPATVELLDDDEAPERILLAVDPVRVVEGDGPVAVTVTVSLDRSLRPEATTVTVSVRGGGDPYAVDFAGVPDFRIDIPAGATSGTGTFTLTPEDDDADEVDETLTVSGVADLPVTPATVALLDDDEVVRVLSVADAESVESAGGMHFDVTLDGPSPAQVTVRYATADPARPVEPVALAGADYEAASGTLTFAPGEVSRTVPVAVLDDGLDEADEAFELVLSEVQGAVPGRGTALGTIRDDDEPPAMTVEDAAGDEDVGVLEFAVTLSAPSGIGVSVAYATADGSATAGSDYSAAADTLLFAPGDVSLSIRVAILDDAVHEADEETFELSLSALVNATAADASATGTIRDDDLEPPRVAGRLPAAMLCVGGAAYEVDLADYFGGDELRYSAVSSAPEVATAALAGRRLTVVPAAEGEASVTVTASNDAGTVESSLDVRVVTDPAELEAVDAVLASIARGVLTGVSGSVQARFAEPGAARGQGDPAGVGDEAQVVPDAREVVRDRWSGAPMHRSRTTEWSRPLASRVFGDDPPALMNRTHRRGMAPFSFSLDSGQPGSTGPSWSVWGRGDLHRFESGIGGSSHDGALEAIHLGADVRTGDWLAGVSVARSRAEADYRFMRSADACGGSGTGEGFVDAGLTSAHPYAGRRVGGGWVWATVGAGEGEVAVQRCATGERRETDLSMKLGALGGRHPFAVGERTAWSVVEEVGVLALNTGHVPGPVGDRSVTVGQARLGLEAAGVVSAGCDCSLSSFVRAFARGDWGDGATGAGLELVTGLRFRHLPRRLGIEAGVRALVAHSAEDARERSANVGFSILPRPDGTGWQVSLTWHERPDDPRLDLTGGLGGSSPWAARPTGVAFAGKRGWHAESRLGYGFALQRGLATPFVELDVGGHERAGVRFGMRHEFGDRLRGLEVRWILGRNRGVGAGNGVALSALGRF